MSRLNDQDFRLIVKYGLAACLVPGVLEEAELAWVTDLKALYAGDGSGNPILVGPGAAPGGLAGGQLTGSYPNPVLLYGPLSARPVAPTTPGFLYFATDAVFNGAIGRLQVWRP